MLILAILAVGNFFVSDYRFQVLNKHGEIINKSGKQRMISQRSLLLTHMYLNHNIKSSLKELNHLLQVMQQSNDFLISTPLTPKLKKLYFNDGLKKDVDNFVKHLKYFIKNPTKRNNFPYKEASKLLLKLDKAVKLHEEHYNQDIENIKQIELIILAGILLMLLLLVIFIFIPTKKDIESKMKEIELHQQQIKQKDLDILAQVKNAQMGEMIGNIAHQWRQPLSAISTSTTGMQIQKECGLLSDEDFDKTCKLINSKAQFLSETINTFTNYIKEIKELKTVILQENIQEAIDIEIVILKNNHIKLINNIDKTEPIEITMIVGELSQVLINIFNNAKDILVQHNIENGWIKIDLIKQDNEVNIIIEDNGGGIPKDILPKIFDPYFTTKHQSQGTGLGLHMSRKIIEESLNGKLNASNSQNGAVFTITLPLS